MNSDVIVIGLVVIFGGALSYVGLLASQLVERRRELKQARVDAQRYGQHLHI
jgi:hypothetical protein